MKHTIIGIVAFVLVAWIFYWFFLDQPKRDFIANMLEPPTLTPLPSKKGKPICSQIVVPTGDCIPQHLANLPPDPGPAGALTIEGIDSDKDGVRDDVQRRIVERWGHSERAVQALFLFAKFKQQQIKYGGDVTKEEAIRIAQEITSPVVQCYMDTVPEDIRQDRAMERVAAMMVNTPARFERWRKFDSLLHMGLFSSVDMTIQEACGYDPKTLNN